jgi:hypothetical protein
MSIKVMTWVWDHSPYRDDALLIHLALADWSDDAGICWPTQAKIAEKARCSVEHVRRVIRRMETDGYLAIISTSKGPGSSTRYQLKNPTNGGVSEKSPTSKGRKAPHPSPNNRQEPPINTSTNVKIKCPYCSNRITWGDPHDCPTMNQRIK